MSTPPFAFDILEPGLALSGMPGSVSDLVDHGFDAALNVSDFENPPYAEGQAANLNVVRQPLPDNQAIPLMLLTAAVLELAALRQRGGATLVHCSVGQSRSPTVVALYLMARDSLTWPQAISFLVRKRPQVAPHPFLTNEATRASIVARVRAFLAGDASILEESRKHAREFRQTDRSRPADPPRRLADWNLIEAGLGLGAYPSPFHDILQHGFDRIINTAAFGKHVPYLGSLPPGVQAACHALREDEPVDPGQIATIVTQLQAWRREGRSVLVHCMEGRSVSALIVCLYLMLDRGWDYASALWYVRLRRRAALPHSRLTENHSIENLLACCRQ